MKENSENLKIVNTPLNAISHQPMILLCNADVVRVGLAEWVEHPLMMLKVRGLNTFLSENKTSLLGGHKAPSS